MKNLFAITILIFLGIFVFNSCDKIDPPYTRNGGNIVPPDSNARKVLLEEFTGQRCQNCPAASEIAHELQAKYPTQVILLSIHAGTYAVPQAAPFDYDFRTSTGDSLNNFFSIAGYPSGMVSRVQASPGNYVVSDGLWESTLDTMITAVPIATITITPSYNAAGKIATATVRTKFLSNADTSYNLCIFLTENNIVKPQQYVDSIRFQYTHMHVLRGSFNGAWGTQVASKGTTAGTIVDKTYTMVLKNDFVPANCTVVAFLYRTDTYQIVQAEEIKLN